MSGLLEKLITPEGAAEHLDPMLTPQDLAKKWKVSKVWIYKLCDQGRIPFFRLAGKAIRFDPGEIKEWMEQGRGGKYRRNK